MDLDRIFYGNCLVATPEKINISTHPMLHSAAESFNRFLSAFNATEFNFEKSYILNNPVIKRGRGDQRRLDLNFFSHNVPPLNEAVLSRVKISDIMVNGALKTLDEINFNDNLHISLLTYLRLSEALQTYKRDNRVNIKPWHKATSLHDFLVRFKKGSRPIRKIISQYRQRNVKPSHLNTVKTFFRLIQIPMLSDDNVGHMLSLWNTNCMPNKLREFCFKFHNNLLGLNTRVAHFAANINRVCSFCVTGGAANPPDETFVHLFFECNFTSNTLGRICVKFFPELQFANERAKKEFWFCGIDPRTNQNDCLFLRIAVICTLFGIWENKLRKQLPSLERVCNDFFFTMSKISRGNRYLQYTINSSNLTLCRSWDLLRDRHG